MEGEKVEKKEWDNCNSTINKIYLKILKITIIKIWNLQDRYFRALFLFSKKIKFIL